MHHILAKSISGGLQADIVNHTAILDAVHVGEIAQARRPLPVLGIHERVIIEKNFRRMLWGEITAPALEVNVGGYTASGVWSGADRFNTESAFTIGGEPAMKPHLIRAWLCVQPVSARVVGVYDHARRWRDAVGPVNSPLHSERSPTFVGRR